MENAETLAADIAAHIAGFDADAFEPLALRVFAYQYQRNVPYRRFCDGRGQTPDTVTRWQDIPPAPAAAFKRFALTCNDPALCVPEHGGRTFHSSGTTGAETSKHYMDAAALGLYRASLFASYRHFVDAGESLSIRAVMPTPEEAPFSSLSFMLDTLIANFGGEFLWGGSGEEMISAELSYLDEATVVFGTAFAWVQLCDFLSAYDDYSEKLITANVPPNSRIVETGGFKGRSREVERGDLYQMFTERLGVPATHCIAEYGMSEMASQFYDSTFRDHVTGIKREPRKVSLPHLLRTRVIDPVTGQEARRGEPGILAHYDIANLNSCLAIQTEDYGYAHEGGDGFVLLGRAPGATLRGCSLTAEEFAARQAGT